MTAGDRQDLKDARPSATFHLGDAVALCILFVRVSGNIDGRYCQHLKVQRNQSTGIGKCFPQSAHNDG